MNPKICAQLHCNERIGPFQEGDLCHKCKKPTRSMFDDALEEWNEDSLIKEIGEIAKAFIESVTKCPICRTVNKIPKNRQKVFSDSMCMICCDEKADVFLPQCGHLCMCSDCLEKHVESEGDRQIDTQDSDFDGEEDFIEELERESSLENDDQIVVNRDIQFNLDDIADEYMYALQEAVDQRFQEMMEYGD